ncbi:MAG: hypothetical protein IID35_06600, partial [Planctomycetes bacterium]|nr:hypothetical protein [Planctomycetota bacterium]
MSTIHQHEDTRLPPPEADPGSARHCVACDYNLFGLGDEPRCPECGLMNITDGFRREVWALVDSGKWFFSGFLSPFKKRPPGWWWALDRPGDVRRSFRFAVGHALISAVLVFGFALAADSVLVETTTISFLSSSTSQRPTRTFHANESVTTTGA